ncbi:MAG: hypothetical protein RJA49_927 [Actinomycetota bacterium]
MQRTALIGLITIGFLTGCGGDNSSSPPVPTTSPASTSANVTTAGDTSPTTAAIADSGGSGQFAKYAPIVCAAIAEALTSLTSQNVPEVYRAALVTTLADGRIPITELADAVADPAVAATCSSDYHDFLERADMPDLSNL